MIQFVVLVKTSTLRALNEHTTATQFSGVMPLNEHESLVAIDMEVVETIVTNARPDDKRIDDVIMRVVL